MIRITQLKLSIEEPIEALEPLICKHLKIQKKDLVRWEILRRSLDARRGHAFVFSYTVEAEVTNEAACWKRLTQKKDMELREETAASFPAHAGYQSKERPVVVGFGPAGMFCALVLARAGLCPIVLERGRRVEERAQDVERFWKEHVLQPESNVQFGEGGAGTFSDGKLNTLVKDKEGLGRWVLREMVQAGAPEEILYDSKPHIGTDRLREVVRGIRQEIENLGGEIRFETKLEDVEAVSQGLRLSTVSHGVRNHLQAEAVFLGIGHSARDTFSMLKKAGLLMEPKPFAVGLRIEHPQSFVDHLQYREYAGHPALGAASYKVAYTEPGGRGVYSFCMCPGGLVVASASEEGEMVVNGMSNYRRDEKNANSAILVTVTPEDYQKYGEDELAGVAFQRCLERAAYRLGGSDWRAPVQYVGEYLKGQGLEVPKGQPPFSEVEPSCTSGWKAAELGEVLPEALAHSLGLGLLGFEKSMPGFASAGAVLTGVESRSSSPVRMLRDAAMNSSIPGLYPIGEGAGYAGGIMSAAMDGLKAARMYLRKLEGGACGM